MLRMMYRKSGGLEESELPSDSWERIELLNMLKDPEDKWPGVPLFDDRFSILCRWLQTRRFSRRHKLVS